MFPRPQDALSPRGCRQAPALEAGQRAPATVEAPAATPPEAGRHSCLGSTCSRADAGHDVSQFLRRQLLRAPWLWRPGIVTSVTEQHARLDCPSGAGLLSLGGLRIWHHRPLGHVLRRGRRVLVNERFGALQVATLLLNVSVSVPEGSVPVPVDVEVWAQDALAEALPLTGSLLTGAPAWQTI